MAALTQKQVDAWWLKGFTGAFDYLEHFEKENGRLDAESLARLAAAEIRFETIMRNTAACNPVSPPVMIMNVVEGILTALEQRLIGVTQGFADHEIANLTIQLARIRRIINHDT